MLTLSKNNITLTRGDSGSVKLTPVSEDGAPYFLKEGETVIFCVRLNSDEKAVIEKTLTADRQNTDGSFEAYLSPADTDIECGAYFYEAKLVSAGSAVTDTFIGGGRAKLVFRVV